MRWALADRKTIRWLGFLTALLGILAVFFAVRRGTGQLKTIEISLSTILSAEEAREALDRGPRLVLAEMPLFLRIVAPEPRSITGEGMSLGDRWKIGFEGGEITAEVVADESGHWLVNKVRDDSSLAPWIDWREADWRIEPDGEGAKITLAITFVSVRGWFASQMQSYTLRRTGDYVLAQLFESSYLLKKHKLNRRILKEDSDLWLEPQIELSRR